jgi:hypothetical protein
MPPPEPAVAGGDDGDGGAVVVVDGGDDGGDGGGDDGGALVDDEGGAFGGVGEGVVDGGDVGGVEIGGCTGLLRAGSGASRSTSAPPRCAKAGAASTARATRATRTAAAGRPIEVSIPRSHERQRPARSTVLGATARSTWYACVMSEHRRVEPRTIAGTGMATDPERIHAVAAEAERHARAWRPVRDAAFDDVLERAPPKGELADVSASSIAPTAPAEPNAKQVAGAPPPEKDPRGAGPVVAREDQAASATERPLTRRLSPRAPDPRERLLHARLDGRPGAVSVAPASPASSSAKIR